MLTAYRQCKVDYFAFADDFTARKGEDAVDREALLEVLTDFLKANNLKVDWEGVESAPNEALVNALAMMSPYGPAEKQAMLEAPDLKTRAEILIAVTEMDLAKKRTSGEPGCSSANTPRPPAPRRRSSPIQPKCRPRVAQALANAAKPNTAANVAMIQCRAGSDAIQGAANSSTPPAIQAIVPACHTSRISVRSRGGSIVARANTLVSPITPWIAMTIATTPAPCSRRSRIGLPPYSTVWNYARAGGCQYSCVWWDVAGTDMTDQLSAQDWLDQGLKTWRSAASRR